MAWIKKLHLVFFLALVIHQQEGINAARILGLFPFPAKSHFVMSEALMKGLAARGHQVDVVSHFPLKYPLKNYRDISLAGTAPMPVNNITLDTAETFTTGTIRTILNLAGVQVCELMNVPQLRNIIDNPPNDPPYDLVITEMFVADCFYAFGPHLKVPTVGLVTSKIFDWMNAPLGNPSNTAFVPSVFSKFSQRMNFFERLQNTLISHIITAQFWYYSAPQAAIVNKYFNMEISSTRELYSEIAVVLINTHPSLDSVKPLPPGIVEVGGIHVTEGDQDLSPEVQKWLDDSNAGCIYFSFGSMVKIESFPKETLKAFYTAFERIAPVRVLMKIAKKDELPAGLPKNVMTSPWLPQTRVLKHENVKAFVTHGGLMSNMEAVTYGVPMVSVPIFGDQPLNAHFNEQNHIGITVNYRTVTADSFTKSLNTILKDTSYSESTKLLSKLFTDRPMNALDTGIFWVEYVIRNGNVLKSPAAELSWWQVELLDVYGFFIAVVSLALYLVKRLLGLVFSLLLSKSDKLQSHRSSKASSKSKKNK